MDCPSGSTRTRRRDGPAGTPAQPSFGPATGHLLAPWRCLRLHLVHGASRAGEPDLGPHRGRVGAPWPVPGPPATSTPGRRVIAAVSADSPGRPCSARGRGPATPGVRLRHRPDGCAPWPEVWPPGRVPTRPRVQAWAVVPGMGTGAAGVRAGPVLGPGPGGVDATRSPCWPESLAGPTAAIRTPRCAHPARREFERLTGRPRADRVSAARAAPTVRCRPAPGNTTIVAAPDGRAGDFRSLPGRHRGSVLLTGGLAAARCRGGPRHRRVVARTPMRRAELAARGVLPGSSRRLTGNERHRPLPRRCGRAGESSQAASAAGPVADREEDSIQEVPAVPRARGDRLDASGQRRDPGRVCRASGADTMVVVKADGYVHGAVASPSRAAGGAGAWGVHHLTCAARATRVDTACCLAALPRRRLRRGRGRRSISNLPTPTRHRRPRRGMTGRPARCTSRSTPVARGGPTKRLASWSAPQRMPPASLWWLWPTSRTPTPVHPVIAQQVRASTGLPGGLEAGLRPLRHLANSRRRSPAQSAYDLAAHRRLRSLPGPGQCSLWPAITLRFEGRAIKRSGGEGCPMCTCGVPSGRPRWPWSPPVADGRPRILTGRLEVWLAGRRVRWSEGVLDQVVVTARTIRRRGG